MTSTAKNPGTDDQTSETTGVNDSAVRVLARRTLVDSPSRAGYALLSLALAALIAAIIIAATGPTEWALTAALLAAVTGVAGARRLAALR
ncbi:hypothetical protein CH263_20000 [Rhodococcus sp. 06-1059B-a]|nr:hypothetical protein [Rhodococcus sp. 06-1059B-a]OZD60779.1 hypothetical protein CH263_20000 [Rhodococcus sp. 06-1059B-a]